MNEPYFVTRNNQYHQQTSFSRLEKRRIRPSQEIRNWFFFILITPFNKKYMQQCDMPRHSWCPQLRGLPVTPNASCNVKELKDIRLSDRTCAKNPANSARCGKIFRLEEKKSKPKGYLISFVGQIYYQPNKEVWKALLFNEEFYCMYLGNFLTVLFDPKLR